MAMFDGHIRRLCAVPPASIDAVRQRLTEVIGRASDYWAEHDDVKPNKDPVFAMTTEHIVLGFPATLTSARHARRFPVWKDWEDVIQPIIDLVTPLYGYRQGQVNRIMLAKLLAGAEISKHIDADPSARLPHKIHVPITTNAGVEMWEGDARYHLEAGIAYEVNNQIAHGGANRGPTDRVHLIFDYFDVGCLDAIDR